MTKKYIIVMLVLMCAMSAFVTAVSADDGIGIGDGSNCAVIGIEDGSGYTTIPITVSNGTDVGSCDVNIAFDPSIVTTVKVDNGDMDNMFSNTEHVEDGWIRIGAYQGTNPGIMGDFILANVTFSSVATSGNCPLVISVTTFKDGSPAGRPMCYTVSNGTYTATADGGNGGDGTYPPTPTPTDDGNVTPTQTPVITPTQTPVITPTKILPHDDPITEGINQIGVIIGAAIAAILLVIYGIAKARKDK